MQKNVVHGGKFYIKLVSYNFFIMLVCSVNWVQSIWLVYWFSFISWHIVGAEPAKFPRISEIELSMNLGMFSKLSECSFPWIRMVSTYNVWCIFTNNYAVTALIKLRLCTDHTWCLAPIQQEQNKHLPSRQCTHSQHWFCHRIIKWQFENNVKVNNY